MAEELLGAGLDIDGWSYLKTEGGRNWAQLVDRSFVHRQQFPVVKHSLLGPEEHKVRT